MDSPSGLSEPPGEDAERTTVVAADSDERDDRVLLLREEGRTFAGIARDLGFEGTLDANAAFIRALRRQPPTEQESLRSHELARLDALGNVCAVGTISTRWTWLEGCGASIASKRRCLAPERYDRYERSSEQSSITP